MKTILRSLFFSFTWSLAFVPSSRGAETGAISGRVQNIITGQYLNNAGIAVRDTDRVVFSDESGTYRVAGVAETDDNVVTIRKS